MPKNITSFIDFLKAQFPLGQNINTQLGDLKAILGAKPRRRLNREHTLDRVIERHLSTGEHEEKAKTKEWLSAHHDLTAAWQSAKHIRMSDPALYFNREINSHAHLDKFAPAGVKTRKTSDPSVLSGRWSVKIATLAAACLILSIAAVRLAPDFAVRLNAFYNRTIFYPADAVAYLAADALFGKSGNAVEMVVSPVDKNTLRSYIIANHEFINDNFPGEATLYVNSQQLDGRVAGDYDTALPSDPSGDLVALSSGPEPVADKLLDELSAFFDYLANFQIQASRTLNNRLVKLMAK